MQFLRPFQTAKIPRWQTAGDSLLAFCLSLYQVTRNTLDTFVVFQKEVEYLLSIYTYKLAIVIPVGHVWFRVRMDSISSRRGNSRISITPPHLLLSLRCPPTPLVQISSSPQPSAAVIIKYGGDNFHPENTEHMLNKITPTLQATLQCKWIPYGSGNKISIIEEELFTSYCIIFFPSCSFGK